MIGEVEINQENPVATGYEELQKLLDKIVGRIGLKSTINLLKGCVAEKKQTNDEGLKWQGLPSFILSRVKGIYQMEEKEIFSGNTRDCADARKICYHLCSKFTGYSRPKIGLFFGGASKRKVQDSIYKAEEMLSVPKFHKVFCSNYELAEKAVLEFLAKG